MKFYKAEKGKQIYFAGEELCEKQIYCLFDMYDVQRILERRTSGIVKFSQSSRIVAAPRRLVFPVSYNSFYD